MSQHGTPRKPTSIISIHIGQAGVQIGTAMWHLLLHEHGLNPRGFKENGDRCLDSQAQVMFHQWSGPKFTAKACFIDSDEYTLSNLRSGPLSDVFQWNYVMHTCAESGGLYSRGNFVVAEEVVDKVVKYVRQMAEESDNPCGFLFTHSLGGGTGSGVTARLLNVLKTEYPKAAQVELAVMPSQKMKSNNTLIVEPYNISLFLKDTMEEHRAVIVVDNEALFRMVYSTGSKTPNYNSINSILAHVLSATTAGTRYGGFKSVGFRDIETTVVASKRLRFASASFAPLAHDLSSCHNIVAVSEVMHDLFSPRRQLLTADFHDPFVITSTVLYRSYLDSLGEVQTFINKLINTKTLRFVPWAPAAIKIGLAQSPTGFLPVGEILHVPESATLLYNTTAVIKPFEHIYHCVSSMLRKRAFLHWYTRSGMFADELTLAQDSLSELISDYSETASPDPCSDESECQ
ncbi:tubulin alpha-3 chain-like isoform X1 [Cimex lectularius]|uniref:Tubulin gamma chain n=1 Tax=Cimex lectularius TaxID=79782 RepID=A0A8I6RNJ2_CIMLE|nr:tubulin alpha-3 chain-like isoform X1 [Cimex lectularius]